MKNIQRWEYYRDTSPDEFGSEVGVRASDRGQFVSYEDHLTETNMLRAALTKAKPIVGAAVAASSNESRPLREKVYNQIVEALS